jgi:beta-N-acetylhexosaminidase
VTVQIDDQSTPTEYDLVRKLAQLADVLVVNGFVRVASYKGSIDLSSDQITLLRELIGMKKPLMFTAFGSPFVLAHVPELPAYAVTYDISPTAEVAAVKALTGEIAFKGHLPINLSNRYPLGHGLTR